MTSRTAETVLLNSDAQYISYHIGTGRYLLIKIAVSVQCVNPGWNYQLIFKLYQLAVPKGKDITTKTMAKTKLDKQSFSVVEDKESRRLTHFSKTSQSTSQQYVFNTLFNLARKSIICFQQNKNTSFHSLGLPSFTPPLTSEISLSATLNENISVICIGQNFNISAPLLSKQKIYTASVKYRGMS